MTTTRRHRRVLALVAMAATVLLAGASCGGDDDDDAGADPTTSETSATSSPPTTLSPEEEAEAVYLEFVEVVERLLTSSPDPDDPDLARLAVDPVLSTIRDGTATQQAENQLWQLGELTAHNVTSVLLTSAGATLRDCVVENDRLVDQDDGRVVEETPLTTRDLEVTLIEGDNGWVVSEIATLTEHPGQAPCDG